MVLIEVNTKNIKGLSKKFEVKLINLDTNEVKLGITNNPSVDNIEKMLMIAFGNFIMHKIFRRKNEYFAVGGSDVNKVFNF